MNCPWPSCSAGPRRSARSADTVPNIRNIGTGMTWVFSFRHRPLWPSDSRSAQGGEKGNHSSCREYNSGCPALINPFSRSDNPAPHTNNMSVMLQKQTKSIIQVYINFRICWVLRHCSDFRPGIWESKQRTLFISSIPPEEFWDSTVIQSTPVFFDSGYNMQIVQKV
jgi:hypothetical protein